MSLRHLLLFATFVSCILKINAIEPSDSATIIDEINAGGNITIVAPDELANRLRHTTVATDTTETTSDQPNVRVGYRVQVFDDNNATTAKRNAQARKQQIENRFPEFNAYIQFRSPYWRVKVGDFPTRSEAEVAMEAIRQAFPSLSSQLRVVRDRINPQE